MDEILRRWPLAWAPNKPVVEEVMHKLAERTNVKVKKNGFATEQEMEDFLIKRGSGIVSNFLGGIVFTNDFPDDNTFPKDIEVRLT